MEITEKELYSIYGVEAPEEGAKEQEVAAPAKGEEAENAEETETSVDEAEDAVSDDEADEETDSGDGDEKPHVQSPEERKRNAAARRKAETQKKIDEAVAAERERVKAEAKAELERFLSAAKLKNPKTGRALESGDVDAFVKDAEDARVERELSSGRVSKETIEKIVSENADVKAAKKIIEDKKSEEMKSLISEEIKKISEFDKSVKDVKDLTSREDYPKIYALVKRGYSISDAYFSVNRTALMSGDGAAELQRSASLSGREHQRRASARGSGSATVPPEEMALYRAYNPGMSERDIVEDYNKRLKRRG